MHTQSSAARSLGLTFALVSLFMSASAHARICLGEVDFYKRFGLINPTLEGTDAIKFRAKHKNPDRAEVNLTLQRERSTEEVSGTITSLVIGDDGIDRGTGPRAGSSTGLGAGGIGNLVKAQVLVRLENNPNYFGLVLDQSALCAQSNVAMFNALLNAYESNRSVTLRVVKIKLFGFPVDQTDLESITEDVVHPGGLIYTVIPSNTVRE